MDNIDFTSFTFMIKFLHLNGLLEAAKNKNKNVNASNSIPSPIFQGYGYRHREDTIIRENLGFRRHPSKTVSTPPNLCPLRYCLEKGSMILSSPHFKPDQHLLILRICLFEK